MASCYYALVFLRPHSGLGETIGGDNNLWFSLVFSCLFLVIMPWFSWGRTVVWERLLVVTLLGNLITPAALHYCNTDHQNNSTKPMHIVKMYKQRQHSTTEHSPTKMQLTYGNPTADVTMHNAMNNWAYSNSIFGCFLAIWSKPVKSSNTLLRAIHHFEVNFLWNALCKNWFIRKMKEIGGWVKTALDMTTMHWVIHRQCATRNTQVWT